MCSVVVVWFIGGVVWSGRVIGWYGVQWCCGGCVCRSVCLCLFPSIFSISFRVCAHACLYDCLSAYLVAIVSVFCLSVFLNLQY